MSTPASAPVLEQPSVSSLKKQLQDALNAENRKEIIRLVPLVRERTQLPRHFLNTMMHILPFNDFKTSFLAAEVKWSVAANGKYRDFRIKCISDYKIVRKLAIKNSRGDVASWIHHHYKQPILRAEQLEEVQTVLDKEDEQHWRYVINPAGDKIKLWGIRNDWFNDDVRKFSCINF